MVDSVEDDPLPMWTWGVRSKVTKTQRLRVPFHIRYDWFIPRQSTKVPPTEILWAEYIWIYANFRACRERSFYLSLFIWKKLIFSMLPMHLIISQRNTNRPNSYTYTHYTSHLAINLVWQKRRTRKNKLETGAAPDQLGNMWPGRSGYSRDEGLLVYLCHISNDVLDPSLTRGGRRGPPNNKGSDGEPSSGLWSPTNIQNSDFILRIFALNSEVKENSHVALVLFRKYYISFFLNKTTTTFALHKLLLRCMISTSFFSPTMKSQETVISMKAHCYRNKNTTTSPLT